MATINWKTTAENFDLISQIADRAVKNGWGKKQDLMMDLTATHCNGNPLDLEGLLAANGFNFAHDVCGIVCHLDRNTGKLGNCFSPRFSVKLSA